MESQLFSAASLSALLAIVLIDLVLAGDNALVIGLAARNLPRQAQRKVIFWGTFVAIAVRVAGVPSDLQQINKRSVHRAFDVWGARAAIRAGTELQALARHTETAQRFSADARAMAKEAQRSTER